MLTDGRAERESYERAAGTSPDDYRRQVGTVFDVDAGIGLSLRLDRVSETRVSGGFLQFSLYFHGPASHLLPQGIYTFDHPALGRLALFVVPILGSDRERIVYEACFTRRADAEGPAHGENGARC